MSNAFTLLALNEHLRRVVALNFQSPLWVTAEIAQAGRSRGHWYIELIQKGEGGTIVAQASAMLWLKDTQRIRKNLGFALEDLLQEGTDLKWQVLPEFHERYGLKLMVQDIDPAYTSGQWALRRRQTLQRLQQEGLTEMNGRLPLPPVLQRIAVITSPEAAGWQDFHKHLQEHPECYAFKTVLFPVAVQGRNAVPEIAAALRHLATHRTDFHAVVILRGGGGRLDLAAFDDYEVCAAAARLPLPVFSGIGHETDESLLDIVAHTAHKTPTATADFLIRHNQEFEKQLSQLASVLKKYGMYRVQYARLGVQQSATTLQWKKEERVRTLRQRLDHLTQALPAAVAQRLQRQYAALTAAAATCAAVDPMLALRRGYSLTRINGNLVRSVEELPTGTIIETEIADGRVRSVIT